MAQVVNFPSRQAQVSLPTITKFFDGQYIELIDVDALSLAERIKYFETEIEETSGDFSPDAQILLFTQPA